MLMSIASSHQLHWSIEVFNMIIFTTEWHYKLIINLQTGSFGIYNEIIHQTSAIVRLGPTTDSQRNHLEAKAPPQPLVCFKEASQSSPYNLTYEK